MPRYHFDPVAGNDANSGLTEALPKKNASSVTFVANDECVLKAGTEWTPPAGTQGINIPANGVRVGAYGYGDVPPRINGAQVARGINVGTNIANWVIEDVWIDNVSGGTSRRGITNATTSSSETTPVNGRIQRVKITNVMTDGANDCNGMSLFGEGIKVLECELEGIATDGIWVRGRNTEIAYTKVRKVAQDDLVRGAFGDCIQFGGTGATDFSGGSVHHCELDRRGSFTNKNAFIINGGSATLGFSFYENDVWMETAAGLTAVYLDTPGVVAWGNRVRGGAIGMFLGNGAAAAATGNRVEGAISGIQLAGSMVGGRVINNLLISCGTGIYASNNDATTIIRNNIMAGCVIGMLRHSAMQESHNLFSGVTTMVAWASTVGSMGVGSRDVPNIWDYLNQDGSLKTPFDVDGIPMLNPLGSAGSYVEGVRLMGGHKLSAFRPVIGAFPEGRY